MLRPKRLKIGFLVDDGVVKVQPPVERAVREVVAALRAVGHEGEFCACSEWFEMLTWS
jgi:amidase